MSAERRRRAQFSGIFILGRTKSAIGPFLQSRHAEACASILKGITLKRNFSFFILAFGSAVSVFASAQTTPTQGLTREQVREEMAQYAAAGFNPARQNPRTWVDDAQAASAKVRAARGPADGSNRFAERGTSHRD